jgi:PAS domain S-box-containing protein
MVRWKRCFSDTILEHRIEKVRSIRLSRKVLLLVTVPVVFELGMVAVLSNLVEQARAERRKTDISRQMVGLINSALLAHTERMQMLYLSRVGGFDKASKKVDALASKASQCLYKCRELSKQSPEDGALFNKVVDLVYGLTDSVKTVNNLYAEGNKEEAARAWMKLQSRIDNVMDLSDEFFLQQTKLQGQKELLLEAKEKAITMALWASMAVSILTAFGLAFLFNRSTSDRLQIIMDNTNRIAAGKPPANRLGGDDELTRIDRLYHQMYEDMISLREKERALLDNAAELICSIDSNLRISDINLSAEKILGYSQQQLIGLRVLDLIETSDQDKVRKALEKAFDKTEAGRSDCSMKREDGTIINTEWATTASAKGDSLYCVISDVTQRKLIEQMRRDFVAMVSHDLRTPLTSIQMTLALTQEEAEENNALTKESLDGLTTAQHSANRLLALVNNLLDLEKLESGIFELQAREMQLRNVLTESLSSVENLARQKKITLRLDSPPELEAYFDDERIAQVVINLVSNGIKFSPKESTIEVKASRNQNMVCLSITDQGRGIPAEMRDQIFERFRQVTPQDQYQAKGTGLGLAICKAIVERHMGAIGVESDAKQAPGSTFWFTLPASQTIYKTLKEEAKNRGIS